MVRPCVAVAYSGGRDSTALLHATLAAAQPLGIEVLALHVHHGLSPRADAWLAHCRRRCARWVRAARPLRFDFRRLDGAPPPGASVEAWAREGRYRALREMALQHGCGLVLLAQHRRDQAETLLLQALRGAGAAGLAAMPRVAQRHGVTWQRPWLDRSSAEIDAYVRRHRLGHVEDDSNQDARYARNRLRKEVWPALLQAFPDAEGSLAASARWAQEALACLDELAVSDLASTSGPEGLHVVAWQALSAARRSNALRAWLARHIDGTAPASLVERLMRELPRSGSVRWPVADGAWLRRYRGVLTYGLAMAPSRAERVAAPAGAVPTCLSQAGRHAVPGWTGVLEVEPVAQGGVALDWLDAVALRARGGGERFQAGPGRPPRSLKKQYQEAGIAAWEREGPLVFRGSQLVFAPGLGLDARVIAPPGAPQFALRWLPAAASSGGARRGPARG